MPKSPGTSSSSTTPTILSGSSIPSSSSSSSSVSLTVTKHYLSKFKKECRSISRFSSFLRECKTDSTKAVCCIACNVQFSIGNSDIGDINRRHIERKKQNKTPRMRQII